MTEIAGALPGVPTHYWETEFLNPSDHAAMLGWALANRERFGPSLVAGRVLDPNRRASLSLRDLGPLAEPLRDQLQARLGTITSRTGTRPFDLASIELELVAYGDGAHFEAHRDIPVGEERRPLGGDGSHKADRMLSAVYYFYKEPKGFTGGELRLHRIGSNGALGDYLDIAPQQNSLVAFPSWVTHQVMEIHCPSGAFEDYRFAVNCWLCRRTIHSGEKSAADAR